MTTTLAILPNCRPSRRSFSRRRKERRKDRGENPRENMSWVRLAELPRESYSDALRSILAQSGSSHTAILVSVQSTITHHPIETLCNSLATRFWIASFPFMLI